MTLSFLAAEQHLLTQVSTAKQSAETSSVRYTKATGEGIVDDD
jgi:hypothetical protein